MSRYLNGSDNEVFDFLTRKSVPPGETIDVPDELDEHYDNHPIWYPIGTIGTPSGNSDTNENEES